MKERPILFSGEMVRAILDGRKVQTRRVVKFRHGRHIVGDPRCDGSLEWWRVDRGDGVVITESRGVLLGECPYGQAGDRLWVRETWAQGISYTPSLRRIAYRATEPNLDATWKPSIHMKREHSRLTLEITDVRVERLDEINEDDCLAEGIPTWRGPDLERTVRESYRDLWDSLNAKRGFGWDVNPWVWVIAFRTVTP